MVRGIIAPSLLAADLASLGSEAKKVLDAGADWLHIDIMDGHFVPNLTIGPPVVGCLRSLVGDTFLDCHCMVLHPWKWVEALSIAGASQITFHIETTPQIDELRNLLQLIRSFGLKAGVALKPQTPVSDELEEVLAEALVDLVLVMTVEPGFGGQSFMTEPLDKLSALRRKFPELNLQVDGGITVSTAPIAARAGANVLVSGTGVFKHPSPAAAIAEMRAGILS